MSDSTDSRSLADLLSDLSHQVTSLLRTESKLLRAELSEKAAQAGAGLTEIMGGVICLIAALIVLLQALIIALAKAGLGAGWSSLLVGVVVAGLGLVLLRAGTKMCSPSELNPDRTEEQLKRDVRVVKDQVQ